MHKGRDCSAQLGQHRAAIGNSEAAARTARINRRAARRLMPPMIWRCPQEGRVGGYKSVSGSDENLAGEARTRLDGSAPLSNIPATASAPRWMASLTAFIWRHFLPQ